MSIGKTNGQRTTYAAIRALTIAGTQTCRHRFHRLQMIIDGSRLARFMLLRSMRAAPM
jgi:hypothetical protein